MRLAFLFLLCAAIRAATYCDEPKEVAADLRRVRALWDKGLTLTERNVETRAILEALVRKFPDDIQANRRYLIDSGVPREELRAAYKKRLDAAPESATLTYLYGLTLSAGEAAGAMVLFASALEKDPAIAWPHMAMAFNYASGPLSDKAKATAHVDAFFTKCPTSYDFFTNRMLGSHASPGVLKRSTAALRERVEAETDTDLFGIYEHLWMLEFKAMPPEEHPSLRARVARDVVRIRSLTPKLSLPMLRVVRDGLKQAGDTAGEAATMKEIARLYPESHDAMDDTMQRWRKEHPFAATDAFRRAQYAASGEWITRWPMSAIARMNRFHAAIALHELPAADVKAAGDQFLNFLKGNNTIYGFKPFEHELAEEYLRRGVHLEEVEGLVSEGLKTLRTRAAEQRRGNVLPPEMARRMGAPLRAGEIAAVDLLAQLAMKQNQREQAEGLEARLAPLEADAGMEKDFKWRAGSRVAELDGRFLDAFMYLEKSMTEAPPATNDFQKKRNAETRKELRRLWTKAGGTEKTWAMRADAGVKEAKDASGWKAPEKAIPAWELKDMSGNKWTSAELAGKTVFVNVWASWCGPCRAEHPHFQKLYERVKDQKDVVVISFNVDEQVGMVQPYMAEGKFTFPVLLAAPFVNGVLDSVSIPRNWLIDKKGAHQLEQIGFGESADWVERMVQSIGKMN